MGGKRLYSDLFNEWKEYYDERISQGVVSKWKIFKELGKSYNLSFTTIQGYFEPDKVNAQARERRLKRREKLNRRKKYDREYKSLPEVKAKGNKYDFWYHKLIRHIPDFIDPIFSKVEEADIEYITAELRKLTDNTPFTYRAATKAIERYNRMIEDGEIRGPLIEEISTGKYKRLEE